MSSPIIARLVARYDEILAQKHLDSTREAIESSVSRPNLKYGDRAICDVLRPLFVTSKQYARLRADGGHALAGLRAAARRVVHDPALREELGYPLQAEPAFHLDPDVEGARIWGRLDGFSSGDSLKFVECNAELAGGLSRVGELGDLFDSLPIIEELRRDFSFRAINLRDAGYDALLHSHRRCGGTGSPHVAFVSRPELDLNPDFRAVMDDLQARGLRVETHSIEEVAWRDEALRIGDDAIDVLAIHPQVQAEFMTAFGPPHPLIGAIASGKTRLLNGAATTMALVSKALFSLLSDDRYAGMFDHDTLRRLRPLVPWTRMLREGRTERDGQPVDLMEHASQSRESLVLKPVLGMGGRGVRLGWECTQEEWERHLAEALDGRPHVLQARVAVPTEEFPRHGAEGLSFDTYHLSCDPFFWNDERVEGFYARMARTSAINIATGGTATAVMIVDDGDT